MTSQSIKTWRVIALIAAVAVLGGFTLRYHVRDNVWPRNFGVVEEGKLYRSGRQTPAMFERLVREHRIKTIVDMGAFAEGSREEEFAARTAKALGVDRLVFRLEGDGTGDPNSYVRALRVIADPARQPVLIHCAAGAQRTSGCIMLYRNITQGQPLDKVYEEAFDFEHDPARNPKLWPYIYRWRDAINRAVKYGGTIDWKPGE